MREQLLDTLKIKLPIVQAGMAGGATTPELVAAVSNSGALGTLGAGYMMPSQMEEAVYSIRRQTNLPFAVNLLIADPPVFVSEELKTRADARIQRVTNQMGTAVHDYIVSPSYTFTEQFQVILDERVPTFSFTFGLLTDAQIEALHSRDIKVIGTATTVDEAMQLDDLGVDVIVAQGSEAGGHRGTFTVSYESAMIGTISLVPQVVQAVTCPVIAAGGIMDGRGMAAALALGAAGIQMGTAFLTCKEAGTDSLHRKAIVDSNDSSTVVTCAFSGKPARGIANEFIVEMAHHSDDILPYPLQNSLTRGLRHMATQQRNAQYMSMWAGQSSALAREVPANQLIQKIVGEYHQVLTSLTPLST